MAYYIIRNDDLRSVWNWRLGAFCWDCDARYDTPGFYYTNLRAAKRRRDELCLGRSVRSISILISDELRERYKQEGIDARVA